MVSDRASPARQRRAPVSDIRSTSYICEPSDLLVHQPEAAASAPRVEVRCDRVTSDNRRRFGTTVYRRTAILNAAPGHPVEPCSYAKFVMRLREPILALVGSAPVLHFT